MLVKGDKLKEPNETFTVKLRTPSGNATVAVAQAMGTIVNDDRRGARRKRIRWSLSAGQRSANASQWLGVAVPAGEVDRLSEGVGGARARSVAQRGLHICG